MKFAQIIARLDAMNAEVTLYRQTYSSDAPWGASIEIKNESRHMELRAKGRGEDVEDALQDAWSKVESIINTLTFSKGFEIPLLTMDASPEREINF